MLGASVIFFVRTFDINLLFYGDECSVCAFFASITVHICSVRNRLVLTQKQIVGMLQGIRKLLCICCAFTHTQPHVISTLITQYCIPTLYKCSNSPAQRLLLYLFLILESLIHAAQAHLKLKPIFNRL